VYDLDKMQNEAEEEGTNRLPKRKQDQATETVDERARILEIPYYEHFFTQQVQMKMTKNQMSS
jgi:hypothetical protein